MRLARTRYKQAGLDRDELDNFLAVVRIDEHRTDPLDDASALLLAQHFSNDEAVYPFFAILTGLQRKQFEDFFALVEVLRSMSHEEKNLQLGPVYALIEILSLAQEAGSLSETQSAELFGRVAERFQHVATPGARTAASLDLVREILAQAKQAGDPDQAMRRLLLGSDAPAQISWNGAVLTTEGSRLRHERFQQVLEVQKVPCLSTVLALTDAARNLGLAKGRRQPKFRCWNPGLRVYGSWEHQRTCTCRATSGS